MIRIRDKSPEGTIRKGSKVHVVAWEYTGGGGFEWYPRRYMAQSAFVQECQNCDDPILKRGKWRTVMFAYKISKTSSYDEVTTEVENHLMKRMFDDDKKISNGVRYP